MKRILIVEDDLAFGTMIQTWLKKKGFDVERVTSVGAAIKAMGVKRCIPFGSFRPAPARP